MIVHTIECWDDLTPLNCDVLADKFELTIQRQNLRFDRGMLVPTNTLILNSSLLNPTERFLTVESIIYQISFGISNQMSFNNDLTIKGLGNTTQKLLTEATIESLVPRTLLIEWLKKENNPTIQKAATTFRVTTDVVESKLKDIGMLQWLK